MRFTHRNIFVFASSTSNFNVVELIPPAASRAEAKNNIFMVTKLLTGDDDDDMTTLLWIRECIVRKRRKMWVGRR